MEEFYGIDLGTTNSCIAIIDEDDSVTVVTNMEGQLTTPSVVAYDEDGTPYVGTAAKANMPMIPNVRSRLSSVRCLMMTTGVE